MVKMRMKEKIKTKQGRGMKKKMREINKLIKITLKVLFVLNLVLINEISLVKSQIESSTPPFGLMSQAEIDATQIIRVFCCEAGKSFWIPGWIYAPEKYNPLVRGKEYQRIGYGGGWEYTGQKVAIGIAGASAGGIIALGVTPPMLVPGVIEVPKWLLGWSTALSGAGGVGIPYTIRWVWTPKGEEFGPEEMTTTLSTSIAGVVMGGGVGELAQTNIIKYITRYNKPYGALIRVPFRAFSMGVGNIGVQQIGYKISKKKITCKDVGNDFLIGAVASFGSDAIRYVGGCVKLDRFYRAPLSERDLQIIQGLFPSTKVHGGFGGIIGGAGADIVETIIPDLITKPKKSDKNLKNKIIYTIH